MLAIELKAANKLELWKQFGGSETAATIELARQRGARSRRGSCRVGWTQDQRVSYWSANRSSNYGHRAALAIGTPQTLTRQFNGPRHLDGQPDFEATLTAGNYEV